MDTAEKILGSQRLVCKNPECLHSRSVLRQKAGQNRKLYFVG